MLLPTDRNDGDFCYRCLSGKTILLSLRSVLVMHGNPSLGSFVQQHTIVQRVAAVVGVPETRPPKSKDGSSKRTASPCTGTVQKTALELCIFRLCEYPSDWYGYNSLVRMFLLATMSFKKDHKV